MATRKKAEGIELLKPKMDPVSIQEITMLDWFAAFALLGLNQEQSHERAAVEAFERAEAMMKERAARMP